MKLLPCLFLTVTVSLSILAENVDSLIIKVPNVFEALEAQEGKGGRMVIYPKSWVINEGKDGRLVAYPKGWKAVEGSDGRKIAHPLGGKPLMGKDGRKVPVPNGELLFPRADTVALLYAAKNRIALKEWHNLVFYHFINSDHK